jgi:thiol:disulfide interchange protein DsbG
MKSTTCLTYCLAIVGLFGFITSPSLAEEKEGGSNAGGKLGRVANSELSLPASIAILLDRGFEFHGTFEVPGEMVGYALSYVNEPVAAYASPSDDYAIVGTLIDAQGNEVMESQIQNLVLGPILEAAWDAFENTRFISEGTDNASHIVYTLTDPNCPYCNALWQNSRPLIEEGTLQLRHVMVGILSEDSIRKAAAIMESDDPASALEMHELNFHEGGITPVTPSEESRALLTQHAQIMGAAGATGTPTSYYRDEEGSVKHINGAVSTDQLRRILGVE